LRLQLKALACPLSWLKSKFLINTTLARFCKKIWPRIGGPCRIELRPLIRVSSLPLSNGPPGRIGESRVGRRQDLTCAPSSGAWSLSLSYSARPAKGHLRQLLRDVSAGLLARLAGWARRRSAAVRRSALRSPIVEPWPSIWTIPSQFSSRRLEDPAVEVVALLRDVVLSRMFQCRTAAPQLVTTRQLSISRWAST